MTHLDQGRNGYWRRRGFTLVEILVVFTLLLLLAAIALPATKDLLKKQTASRAARSVATYFDVAKNRAVAENRFVGVLLERLSNDDPLGRSAAIRLRQLTGVPSYSGDSAGATGRIRPVNPRSPDYPSGTMGSTVNQMIIDFVASDNQLLALSASLVDPVAGSTVNDDLRAPIRNGDRIELPGGLTIPFTIDFRGLGQPDTDRVTLRCNLNDLFVEPSGLPTQLFPSARLPVIPSAGLNVIYRIHRRPTVSTHNSLSLPRGYAIDLNYSGLGQSGNQLAPPADPTNPAFSVAIVFDPSGKVAYVSQSNSGIGSSPVGQIYLMLGKFEGVTPGDLFSQSRGAVANILDPETLWLVIDPASGRTVTAPSASVQTIPTGVISSAADTSVGTAVAESRLFARLSDTVEEE